MKTLIFIARLFAGLIFVFSGFVKAIDPSGSAIKFEEYFLAFHLDFLVDTALPLAILLSAAEMMIGLNLLAGIRMKLTAWLLMIFMSFFTVLTLILALTNPVSDCGCFGDALKLTNWQTFGKNVILLVPTLLIFFNRNKAGRFLPSSIAEWVLSGINFAIPVIISIYCLVHQPILDFRPYQVGANIPEKMTVPEDAPVDVYETTLVYEKDGVRQEFSESNFPWQDTTWKWVETKQILISKGMEPLIHDFSITSIEGNDITQQVLTDSHYVFLIIAPKLENASMKGLRRMNDIAMKADNLGFNSYCITSSTNDQVNDFRNSFQPAFELCTADETTLKTIIRANPGMLILLEGTIIGKWNFRDTPGADELKPNLTSFVIGRHRKSVEQAGVYIIALAILAFYSLVLGFKTSGKKAK